MTIPEKLKSRKFLLTLGVIALDLIVFAFRGEWDETSRQILIVVLGYLGVEGLIDFAKWWTRK